MVSSTFVVKSTFLGEDLMAVMVDMVGLLSSRLLHILTAWHPFAVNESIRPMMAGLVVQATRLARMAKTSYC
jgi:hypothetical protein